MAERNNIVQVRSSGKTHSVNRRTLAEKMQKSATAAGVVNLRPGELLEIYNLKESLDTLAVKRATGEFENIGEGK